MLSNVNIIRSDGNLVTTPESQDGVSSLLIYTEESGATGTLAKYKLFSLSDALTFTSKTTVIYYQIKKYFEKSSFPLFVGIINRTPSATDSFAEVSDLQYFAEGDIRMCGVLNTLSIYVDTQVPKLQLVAESLEGAYMPLQIVYTAIPDEAVEDLTDLRELASPRVSVLIGEDLGVDSETQALYTAGADIVSQIGLILGVISSSPVSESIAAVSKHNVAVDIVDPHFTDGSSYKSKSVTFLNNLDSYGYIFFRKFVGRGGVYINSDSTSADPSITDFTSIALNRVYDSAFRNLRAVFIGELNGSIKLNKQGLMSSGAIKYFEGLGKRVLNSMLASNDISEFSVVVPASQLILATKTLQVTCSIIPVGIAKQIEINLGFTVQV